MPLHRLFPPVLAAIVLTLLLVLAGCSEKPVTAARPVAAPVVVTQVVIKDVPVEISAIGTVEPYQSISIKAMVAGQLQKVHFEEGGFVRRGQTLFSIDPRPYETALAQAEANLARELATVEQIKANLARDRAEAEFADSQARRYARLVEEGIGAQEQAEQFRTNAKVKAEAIEAAKAALATAEAAVRADRAAVQSAKVQLSFCTITSPIDGQTGSLLVNAGNLVKLNETILVTINQLSPTYVSFGVPDQYLPEIRMRARGGALRVEARPRNRAEMAVTGKLAFIDNLVDNQTGTIRLKATFENRDRKLWPGEFVDTVMRLSALKDVPVVPSRALQTAQDGAFVYVVKQDKTAEVRKVQTGPTSGADTVIESGVQPGETVITEGHLRVVPGGLVEVKSGARPAQAS